jgi:hypothetical protein
MIFLFAPGTKLDPDPKKWPCPRAKDGIQRCKDHLWSDKDARFNTQYPLRRRRFGKQVRGETERMSRPEMTFGCRFLSWDRAALPVRARPSDVRGPAVGRCPHGRAQQG